MSPAPQAGRMRRLAERRKLAVTMRASGVKLEAIGAALGITAAGVSGLLKRAGVKPLPPPPSAPKPPTYEFDAPKGMTLREYVEMRARRVDEFARNVLAIAGEP